jgi:hypothetical protein
MKHARWHVSTHITSSFSSLGRCPSSSINGYLLLHYAFIFVSMCTSTHTRNWPSRTSLNRSAPRHSAAAVHALQQHSAAQDANVTWKIQRGWRNASAARLSSYAASMAALMQAALEGAAALLNDDSGGAVTTRDLPLEKPMDRSVWVWDNTLPPYTTCRGNWCEEAARSGCVQAQPSHAHVPSCLAKA